MLLITPEQTLETPRLLLEPLTVSDAPVIYPQLLDRRIYQFIPDELPRSLQDLESRYMALSSRLSPDGQQAWLNWAVRLRNSHYIGTLQATISADFSAVIAYIIFPLFWRPGYAKEGCDRVLNYLFKDYGVTLAIAEIDTRNIASIKLVESLGFERAFTKVNADFFKGATSNEHQYECLSPLISSNS